MPDRHSTPMVAATRGALAAIGAGLLWLCPGSLAGQAAGVTPAYEPLPTLKASDYFDADTLWGEHHKVKDAVQNDGAFNTFTIESEYGTFQVQGTTLARVRIHEIGAIAQLKEVDKVAVAAGAAIDSVANMGKGAYHLVTNPVEAAQGIGSAASRLFNRIGRSARRAEEKINSGAQAHGDAALPTTGERVAKTSQGLVKDVTGANRALRNWAEKLAVDPYTHNPVLRDELEEVSDYDAGGRFSTKLLPLGVVGTVLGSARTVNQLVWMKEPDELQTLNETRLTEMGVSADDSRAFRLNPQYTLTIQTRLVASLDALTGVPGRAEYVAQAADAAGETDARFYQESAYMAEIFNQTESPVTRVVSEIPGACVVSSDKRFACLYPFDYLVWTAGLERNADTLARYAADTFPGSKREMWLTGRASARAVREMADRGWTVREKAVNVLPLAPAPPADKTK